jgi:hypothetical protein
MKTSWKNVTTALVKAKFAIAGGLLAFGFAGCADYAAVGVSSSYYAPDYRPYYVDYGYDGVPWWGPGPYYAGAIVIDRDRDRDVVVRKRVVKNVNVNRNVTVNRNIYYGGHHLGRDFRGGRVAGVRPMRRDRH